jgi:hypothetical protein
VWMSGYIMAAATTGNEYVYNTVFIRFSTADVDDEYNGNLVR